MSSLRTATLRRCDACGKHLLASLRGGGYCLSCAPGDDVPLVPVTWSAKKFLAVQKVYRQAAREHNERLETLRDWSFSLASGSKPGSLHGVKRKREVPLEPGELEGHMAPLPRTSPKKGTGKPTGRPRSLEPADEAKLRNWAKTPGWTVARLIERLNADRLKTESRTVSARTVRRFLKREGLLRFLKLKKPPVQRTRRS